MDQASTDRSVFSEQEPFLVVAPAGTNGVRAWLAAQQARLEQTIASLHDTESLDPQAVSELLVRTRQQLQRILADQRQLTWLHEDGLSALDNDHEAESDGVTADEPTMTSKSELDATQQASDQAELQRLRAEVNLLRERLQSEPASTRSAFCWEQEKLRILRELESDGHSTGPDPHAEQRRRLQQSLQITDEIVSASRREVAEWKRKVEQVLNQASADRVSTQESIDHDPDEAAELQEERDRLLALQQQTREKMRQAEVAMSLERAKLARDRGELQAKMLAMETERAALLEQLQAATQQGNSARGVTRNGKQTGAGRWLSRLGLRED
jgi:hypothetical protein